HIFTGVELDYFKLRDSVKQTKFCENEYDLVVVAGTPWLWDSFQNSNKWKNLVGLLNSLPKAKRIFLGIGSCVDLDVMSNSKTTVLRTPNEIKEMQNIYMNSKVFVRDNYASLVFLNAGVPHTIQYCPSIFCFG